MFSRRSLLTLDPLKQKPMPPKKTPTSSLSGNHCLFRIVDSNWDQPDRDYPTHQYMTSIVDKMEYKLSKVDRIAWPKPLRNKHKLGLLSSVEKFQICRWSFRRPDQVSPKLFNRRTL